MALARLFTANVTGTTATAPGFSATRPSGNAGGSSQTAAVEISGGSKLRLIPIVLGSDGNTFTFKVYRWYASDTLGYIAVPVGLFTATAGTAAGAASKIVLNTELLADTLVQTASSGDTSATVSSAADNGASFVEIPANGAVLFTVLAIKGTCTSCNFAYEVRD